MPKKRYSEEQVVSILKEASAGAKTLEICRKYGVSENTFYKWRAKSRSASTHGSQTPLRSVSPMLETSSSSSSSAGGAERLSRTSLR